MSKKLDKIRVKIDSLDNQIHDLLMQRAEWVSDVAIEKRKNNLQIVHPEREATMIRRLLSRHNSILPEAAIVRIWRELVGAVSFLQSGLKVTVSDPQGDGVYWDMARNYFGSVIPMQRVSNALLALSSVREDEASFAVLPWPQEDDEKPWWSFLLANQDTSQPINIVCALPYGSVEGEAYTSLSPRALVISKIDFKDSSDDNSFVSAELDPSISRARLAEALQEAGLKPLGIHTKTASECHDKNLHFVELAGYVSSDDNRLDKVKAAFKSTEGYFYALGGYPVPPEYTILPTIHRNIATSKSKPTKSLKKHPKAKSAQKKTGTS